MINPYNLSVHPSTNPVERAYGVFLNRGFMDRVNMNPENSDSPFIQFSDVKALSIRALSLSNPL